MVESHVSPPFSRLKKRAGVPTDVAFGGDLGGGTLFGALFHGVPWSKLLTRLA